MFGPCHVQHVVCTTGCGHPAFSLYFKLISNILTVFCAPQEGMTPQTTGACTAGCWQAQCQQLQHQAALPQKMLHLMLQASLPRSNSLCTGTMESVYAPTGLVPCCHGPLLLPQACCGLPARAERCILTTSQNNTGPVCPAHVDGHRLAGHAALIAPDAADMLALSVS